MFDNKLIAKSFMWMFIGLLVTFITGYVICLNASTLALALSGFYIVAVLVELILVIVLSRKIFEMKPITAKIMFLVYSMVTGFTFASIFVVYEMASIIFVFSLAAVLFGIMALFGYYTNIDLSKFSSYLLFAFKSFRYVYNIQFILRQLNLFVKYLSKFIHFYRI